MPWTDDARARIARVPGFVRGVVTARVESFARERGYAEITADVMAEVRRNMPVDFSKRLPFFMRETAGTDSGTDAGSHARAGTAGGATNASPSPSP
jgi:hypothetical protein